MYALTKFDQALILYHAIALSDLLPVLGPLLVGIVDTTLAVEDPHVEYAERETNSSWIIGSCLSCLARRNPTEWRSEVDITAWVTEVIKKWNWSGYALDGLVSMINATQGSPEQIPFDALHEHLRASLLSHSRVLRLSALSLFNSHIVSSGVSAEVLKKCLQAEEVSVDVQGVRERVMRIGRMNHILKDGDETGAEIAVRWLIGASTV